MADQQNTAAQTTESQGQPAATPPPAQAQAPADGEPGFWARILEELKAVKDAVVTLKVVPAAKDTAPPDTTPKMLVVLKRVKQENGSGVVTIEKAEGGFKKEHLDHMVSMASPVLEHAESVSIYASPGEPMKMNLGITYPGDGAAEPVAKQIEALKSTIAALEQKVEAKVRNVAKGAGGGDPPNPPPAEKQSLFKGII